MGVSGGRGMGVGRRAGRGVAAGVLVLGMVAAQAWAQAAASGGWVVEPRWVEAHEQFLASDALAGRGSATRDEAIAAAYVASEFEGYGLKTAPGMTGYVQRAEVLAPVLDGHAQMEVGGVVLEEGKHFRLLTSAGVEVKGPLAAAGKVERGAVVLGGASPDLQAIGRASTQARRGGAAMLLVEDGPGADALMTRWGGGTRIEVRLKDAPEARGGMSLLALRPEAMERVRAMAAGTPVTLAVHPVPNQPVRTTANAIGYLPGTDAAAGTLLLTAHLDHLGEQPGRKADTIWNGANDDAAGTTAVLELAHALASGPRLRRSVLFVCYGSEEIGELGSTYFGAHPPVPLKDLVANLEFEMIGMQDPKMPKGELLLTGWERSDLGPMLKEHGALLGPDPYPEEHFFERSDNYALALKGVVAHTAAGWGTPPTYHQPDDDLEHLDLAFMTRAIQSLVEPVRWLAASDFRPRWNAGGQPTPR